MRILMRFLLTIYILVVLFVSVVVLGCAWEIINDYQPQSWLSLLYSDNLTKIIVSIIVIAVILLSLLLMFYGIRRKKPKSALIKNTGLGGVFISVSAIEEMAMRHIASHEAVRNVKASIKIRDSKANISAKIAIAEGSNIPEVLTSLQASLKEDIEVLAGIQVNKILLLVEKTSQVAKARVE
jgi:uncharacterized alkaline shock family protein YloU